MERERERKIGWERKCNSVNTKRKCDDTNCTTVTKIIIACVHVALIKHTVSPSLAVYGSGKVLFYTIHSLLLFQLTHSLE